MGPTRQVWVRAKAHELEGARHPAHPGPLHVTTHHLITPTCCPACSCHRFLALGMTHAPDGQVRRHVPHSDDWLPQCDAARGARSSPREPGERDDVPTPLGLRGQGRGQADSLGSRWLGRYERAATEAAQAEAAEARCQCRGGGATGATAAMCATDPLKMPCTLSCAHYLYPNLTTWPCALVSSVSIITYPSRIKKSATKWLSESREKVQLNRRLARGVKA